MRYTIYQNNVSRFSPIINDLGWSEAAKTYPAVKAHLEIGFNGSGAFTPDMFKEYTEVAEVEARDLEDVFSIMNLWNSPEAVTKLAPMHSLSVGDIVADGNEYFMVDSIGFTKVNI